mgnify:CR=1 FL=1
MGIVGAVDGEGCPGKVFGGALYSGAFGSVLPVGVNTLVLALSLKGPSSLMATVATRNATIKPMSTPIPILSAVPEPERDALTIISPRIH